VGLAVFGEWALILFAMYSLYEFADKLIMNVLKQKGRRQILCCLRPYRGAPVTGAHCVWSFYRSSCGL